MTRKKGHSFKTAAIVFKRVSAVYGFGRKVLTPSWEASAILSSAFSPLVAMILTL